MPLTVLTSPRYLRNKDQARQEYPKPKNFSKYCNRAAKQATLPHILSGWKEDRYSSHKSNIWLYNGGKVRKKLTSEQPKYIKNGNTVSKTAMSIVFVQLEMTIENTKISTSFNNRVIQRKNENRRLQSASAIGDWNSSKDSAIRKMSQQQLNGWMRKNVENITRKLPGIPKFPTR